MVEVYIPWNTHPVHIPQNLLARLFSCWWWAKLHILKTGPEFPILKCHISLGQVLRNHHPPHSRNGNFVFGVSEFQWNGSMTIIIVMLFVQWHTELSMSKWHQSTDASSSLYIRNRIPGRRARFFVWLLLLAALVNKLINLQCIDISNLPWKRASVCVCVWKTCRDRERAIE